MATHLPVIGGHAEGFAKTTRTDDWRSGPAITLLVFLTFVVYTTWAALQGNHYFVDPYLSPFYSPVLFTEPTVAGAAPTSHAWFGNVPSWWPSRLVSFAPTMLILVFPGSFRFTCYYYRKAYYRSFAGSPPACAVGPLAGRRPYRGETAILVFQNLHRYALYAGLFLLMALWWEALAAFFRHGRFGVGVGTIMMIVNAALLSSWTLGCHSWRHLIAGRRDCFSCGQGMSARYQVWRGSSWLNERHMLFAWCSLVWVVLTDVYVYLVSSQVVRDWNTWS